MSEEWTWNDYRVHDLRLVTLDLIVAAARTVVHQWRESEDATPIDEAIVDLEHALHQWARFWPEPPTAEGV